jgi:hypothetical protein
VDDAAGRKGAWQVVYPEPESEIARIATMPTWYPSLFPRWTASGLTKSAGCWKTAPQAVILRCVDLVNTNMQLLDAWGEKLEASVMVSVFSSLEPLASGFKRMTALADGLMLVFQHPAKTRMPAW